MAVLDDIAHVADTDADKHGYAQGIDPQSLTQEHLDAYVAAGGSAEEAKGMFSDVTIECCCCCCP